MKGGRKKVMEISSLHLAPKRTPLNKSCFGELDLDADSKQEAGASQILPRILKSIAKDATRSTAAAYVAHPQFNGKEV